MLAHMELEYKSQARESKGKCEHRQARALAVCVDSFTPFLSQWSPVTAHTLLSVYPENPNS